MKKENILKKNWEFNKIIENNNQFVSNTLIIYYTESNIFKIGLSIPKKFANAVLRNYLRRQLRMIISQNKQYLSLNFQIILITRKNFIDLSFEEKKQEVFKIIRKVENGNKKIK